MTLEFLPAAAQELAETTAYYEETEAGLGVRFREEVQSVTTAILSHPPLEAAARRLQARELARVSILRCLRFARAAGADRCGGS